MSESSSAHVDLEQVINAIPDIIGIQGKDHYLIRYNEAGYRFLNTSEQEIKGKRCFEMIGRDEECKTCATSITYKTGKSAQVQRYFPEINTWFDIRTYPVKNEMGQIVQVIEHLRDITRQKTTEQQLQYQNDMLRLIANLSTQFVGVSSDELDMSIQQSLDAVGRFTQADRCYIFQFTDDRKRMNNTHEWCSEGISPFRDSLQNIPVSKFRSVQELAESGTPILINKVSELGSEYQADRDEFEHEGIQSLVCLPLQIKGEILGFLGLDFVSTERVWNDQDTPLIRIVSDAIAAAISRNRYQEELEETLIELNRAHELLKRHEQRFRKQQKLLIGLASHEALIKGEWDIAVQTITEQAANILRCQRCSVWFFNSEKDQLNCNDLYLLKEKKHTTAPDLSIASYCNYFSAITEARAIDAHDAIQDPRTQELAEQYLVPNNILSVLDAPIRVGGELVGVVCFEPVGKLRHWTQDEVAFAGDIADQVGHALVNAERFRAEEVLRESEQRFRKLFLLIPDSVFIIDKRQKKILRVNDLACKVYGYSKEQFDGMSILNISNEPEKTRIAIENEISYIQQRYHKRKNGQVFPVEITAQHFHYHNRPQILIVVRDISERIKNQKALQEQQEKLQQQNQQLLVAKTRAEESDRLKSAFLCNMSHEIRTPMNAIIGFSELLLDVDYAMDQRRGFYNIIQNSCDQLLGILNDIIDVSKIEAGIIELNAETFDLVHMVESVIDLYTQVCKGEHNRLVLVINGFEESKQLIHQDRVKLQQVLTNLISNANKFTKEGQILVSLDKLEDHYRFCVRDTGVGIDPSNHHLIFERFRQIKDGLNRTQGGTGIGLAISKAFVELMGGRIWVDSELGSGAKFYFTIPN